MAGTQAQEGDKSEHFVCQIKVKSAKNCESCVNLESQLLNSQEELKNSKVIINLLQKDIEMREANLNKHVMETSEQIKEKFSTWSDVVKGVKKPDTSMQQSESNPIQVIVNQCKVQKRVVNSEATVIGNGHSKDYECNIKKSSPSNEKSKLQVYHHMGKENNKWTETWKNYIEEKSPRASSSISNYTIPIANPFSPLANKYESQDENRKMSPFKSGQLPLYSTQRMTKTPRNLGGTKLQTKSITRSPKEMKKNQFQL
jgi:hypothetical protein